MTTKIGLKTFGGLAKVHDGTLAAAVRGVAQYQARVLAAGIDDLTDNSGGTNDSGGLRKPVAFVAFQAGTADATAKAEFETACGVVRDGIKEIVAQCNTIRAKVPAFDALTDSMGGTAADGTLAAVDDSMTGTDSGEALVDLEGANTVFDTLNARMEQARYYVNLLLTACGSANVASELTPVSYSTTFAAVSTDTGTAVDGTDATAEATVSKAAADAALDIMSDNLKTLTTALNAITADANASAAVTVVAV